MTVSTILSHELTTAPYPIWMGSITLIISSAVGPEIKWPLPVVTALFISQAMYTVDRDVARYGMTPASPRYRASLGTSLREKVSLMTFYRSKGRTPNVSVSTI
jgi:hypothetical protein